MGNASSLVEHLRSELDANNLIVICGAGVSMASTGGDPRSNWAGLIAHGLDWCDGYGVELQGRNGIKRARADLKAQDLLSAADKLQRGLVQGGWWTQFLRETFADLRATDTEVLDAVINLGCPIATTNYDTLLSSHSGRPAVSWRSTSAAATLRSNSNGILHLHGVWTESDSVILSSDSYGSLLATSQTQAIERAMAVRSSMLFVGVGAGISDPNFGSLSKFLATQLEDAGLLHARLIRRGDRLPVVTAPVRDVVFGDNHDDLVPFLRALAPRRGARTKRARQHSGAKRPVDDVHHLLTTPLLRGFDADGPVFNEVWPELILDRVVRSRRTFANAEQRMGDWLSKAKGGTRITLVGGPGAGKSTQLMSIAMSMPRLGHRVPRYLRAETLINTPTSSLGNRSWILLDGLDELGSADQQRVADIVESSPSTWWWFGCRSDFYARQTPLRKTLTVSDEVLELRPLTPGDVDRFLDLFAARSPAATVAATEVRRWREDPRFDRLLDVPLNLTLAVYLAGQSSDDNLEPPKTRYDLYDAFYQYWIKHERSTLSLRRTELQHVRELHSELALAIYISRQAGANAPRSFPGRLSRATTTALTFTILKEGNAGPAVHGFIHDTLMEFLLARDLIDEFSSAADSAGLLATAFNDDVNSFVRDAFAKLSLEARMTLGASLTERYREHADPRIREHLLYYLGRLDLDERPQVFVDAFQVEHDFLVRRSAALGAILHDDLEIEFQFLNLLDEQPDLAEINRAVQLVYFGDQSGDLHAAEDYGRWGRTRKALLDRIASRDRRSLQLRWWDLYTLRSFCQSRAERLTEAERAILEVSASTLSGPRRDRVEEVLRLLLADHAESVHPSDATSGYT